MQPNEPLAPFDANPGGRFSMNAGLEKAQKAIKDNDFETLSVAAFEFGQHLTNDALYAKALIVIGDKLATNVVYQPQAILAFHDAAACLTQHNPLRHRALESILRYVNNLPSIEDKVRVTEYVALQAKRPSSLENDAVNKFIPAVETLPYRTDRLFAFQHAANFGAKGSFLELRSAEAFEKHADALEDLRDRLTIYYQAAEDARPGSSLETRTVDRLLHNINAIPNVTERLTYLKDVAERARPLSLLHTLSRRDLIKLQTESILYEPSRSNVREFIDLFDSHFLMK